MTYGCDATQLGSYPEFQTQNQVKFFNLLLQLIFIANEPMLYWELSYCLSEIISDEYW